MKKSKYYWLGSYRLEIGSVVNPGNWGRIIRMYAPQNNHSQAFIATREYIFESVRLKKFSDRPSRLECAFLCKTLQDAQELQKNRQIDLIYEVELLDDEKVFEADMALIDSGTLDSISAIEERANLYWNPSAIVKPEILTVSPMKIVGII